MKRAIIVGSLLFGILAVAVAAYFSLRPSATLTLPGIVEIQEVRLGSKVGGRIAKIEVQEGQIVSPGQRLVVFDAPELENQREQLKARLDAAEADYQRAKNGPRSEERDAARAAASALRSRYELLKEGWREEEKRWAASELESAAADLKQAQVEFERIDELYRTKSTSKAEFDAARGQYDRSKGKLSAAKAKADMYMLGNRPEEIAEAKAKWEQAYARSRELENGTRAEDIDLALAKRDEAAAKLREVEIDLKETVVSVPNSPEFENALIEVVPFRVGDIVPANQPVIRVLCVRDLWVKTFVPATQMDVVNVGQKVRLRIDSGKEFDGVVFHRAASSEFTPRNVQSVDERRYQVFALKVRVDDPKGVISSGMAAQVTVPLDAR